MTTCIHRHLCTHIDIYLRYCYVTIMSFLNATAKSNTFVRSYSKGKWYTQGNHCLLPIFSYYRLIINKTCMQINLYIIFLWFTNSVIKNKIDTSNNLLSKYKNLLQIAVFHETHFCYYSRLFFVTLRELALMFNLLTKYCALKIESNILIRYEKSLKLHNIACNSKLEVTKHIIVLR